MHNFVYKTHKCGNDTILAICDSSILGKKFEEKNLQISVSEEFYYEKKCKKDSVKNLINSSTIVNAVGKDIVSFLVGENIVKKENILFIQGVPHVQIIKI